MDYMAALDGNLDVANPGGLDDERFAHVLRNEGKRAEQASDEAKDYLADERDNRPERVERSERPKPDHPENDIDAERSDTNQPRAEQPRADDKHGDENQGDAEDDGPLQHARADSSAAEIIQLPAAEVGLPTTVDVDQHRQGAPALPAAATTGQQVADAARTEAAAGIKQPKAAETLNNLVNQAASKPAPRPQAALPGNPDPLADGTLPVPLQKKLHPANYQAESAGTGKSDDNGPKLAQQVQVQVKQQNAPHLRGGRAKHGGDILSDALPRPQTVQTAAGNAFGQQLSNATQPSTNPAANAANVAGIASSDGGAAIQNLQLSVSPERTGQAELPMLAVRAGGNPSPTPPAPQPLSGLPMDGEGKSSMAGLGEDGGKSGGNSANSVSTASAASGTKAATMVQQNAAADVRSPGIQVAMHLSRAVQNGINRLTIRLDPAELGRVEVKLEIGHDGRAIAWVAAERPETLELLQRDARALERALQQPDWDARALERALQQAQTDADSLSFSLSQGDQQGGALADGSGNGADNGKGGGNGQPDDGTPADDGDVLPQVASNRALDISV